VTNMTIAERAARNRSKYIWMATIFGLSLLTCFGLSSNTKFLATRYEQQASQPSTPQKAARRLADMAATRIVFKLTPDTAPQKLSEFAKLEDGMNPELHRLIPDSQELIGANPAAGIQWIQMKFQQSDPSEGKPYWSFLYAQFAFSQKEGDSDQLYRDIKAILAARLAKLGKLKTYTFDNDGFGWNLGGHKVVDIRKGVFENPVAKQKQQVVVLGMAIEQGDPN
jgi:hypothetical protein